MKFFAMALLLSVAILFCACDNHTKPRLSWHEQILSSDLVDTKWDTVFNVCDSAMSLLFLYNRRYVCSAIFDSLHQELYAIAIAESNLSGGIRVSPRLRMLVSENSYEHNKIIDDNKIKPVVENDKIISHILTSQFCCLKHDVRFFASFNSEDIIAKTGIRSDEKEVLRDLFVSFNPANRINKRFYALIEDDFLVLSILYSENTKKIFKNQEKNFLLTYIIEIDT